MKRLIAFQMRFSGKRGCRDGSGSSEAKLILARLSSRVSDKTCFVRRVLRSVFYVVCVVSLNAGAEATSENLTPFRVTVIPEIGVTIAAACTTPKYAGRIVSASAVSERPAVVKIVCSVGRVNSAPSDGCGRDCGYEILRDREVRLTDQTVAALRTAGCVDITMCTKGLITARPGYPSTVRAQPFGTENFLRRDQPPLQIEYGTDIRRFWIIDASVAGRMRVWDAEILPLSNSENGQDSAILISRISLILPGLKADLEVPMVCGRVWIVNDRYLRQINAFKSGRSINDIVKLLAQSSVPKRIC